MSWRYIESADDLPEDGKYVLVKFDDDFISISCIKNFGWEIAGKRKNSIYKEKEKFYTSCDPQYWMPLPK